MIFVQHQQGFGVGTSPVFNARGVSEKMFKAMSKALFGIENGDPTVGHWLLDPYKNKDNLTEAEIQGNTHMMT